MVPFLNMGWLLWFGHFEFSGMMVVESHDNKLIERSPIETCWTRFVWNWWNDGPYDGNIHERIILEILEVPVATSLCDTFSKCNYDNSTLAVLLWNTLGYLFAHVCASLCGQTCRERTWSKWKIDHECTIETATPSWPFCSAGTSLFLCISAFRYQYANPSKHRNIRTSSHQNIIIIIIIPRVSYWRATHQSWVPRGLMDSIFLQGPCWAKPTGWASSVLGTKGIWFVQDRWS